jgi:proteasome lid subunit RPN8/RPN11
MATDIVPGLLEAIELDFNAFLQQNKKIERIRKKIEDGTATYEQAYDYAQQVGEALAKSFEKNISSETLPDGRMYFNIADRVLNPTLERNHVLVAEVSVEIQEILNRKAGLGLKGISPELNRNRIKSIIERVVQEEIYDDVAWMLDEPVVNFTRSVVDDTVQVNAEFQYRSGLYPRIIRYAQGSEPCEWCKNLVGTYKYPGVPEDVYKRHDRCRCVVEYDPGDARRQNVWTREWRR